MFYSHTFLARKGPLGTVWCAAHLQNRLKKSHYISTDIRSAVEIIIDPQVPIALRMSGHLLLGVVRIYSKQVDYFYEDCKFVSTSVNRVVATSKSINLPKGATQAPAHSITMPERFELDAMELDDYYKDLNEDAHTKRQEDITLTEQIPTGNEPYIVITLEEEIRDSPHVEHDSGSAPMQIGEDIPSHVEYEKIPDLDHSTPGVNRGTDRYSSPQHIPSIEVMRDARNSFDFNNSPILPDRAEPDRFLEEQIIRDRNTPTQIKEVLLQDAQFSPPHTAHFEQEHSIGNFDSTMHFSHESPELQIRASPPREPTPPVVVAAPNVRKRKRKNQRFDQETVVNNKQMKKALDDTKDILRKKSERPADSFAIWRQNKRLKKDDAFVEPFITGMCSDLHETYEEDFVSKHHQIVARNITHEDSNVPPQIPVMENDSDMDIETLRNNNDGHASPDRYMPSTSGKGLFTPDNSNFGLRTEPIPATEADEILRTRDTDASNGTFGSEIRTPDSFRGLGFEREHTTLSDIPEIPASPGELRFLDQDDNSPPAECQGTPETGILSNDKGTPEIRALSSRTRAVAQYLKRQSLATTPLSKNSKDSSSEDLLSLNKILEGKSRKISARMFAETLVLKNFELIDLNQDKPYDDITLKVTAKLSKVDFSG